MRGRESVGVCVNEALLCLSLDEQAENDEDEDREVHTSSLTHPIPSVEHKKVKLSFAVKFP